MKTVVLVPELAYQILQVKHQLHGTVNIDENDCSFALKFLISHIE